MCAVIAPCITCCTGTSRTCFGYLKSAGYDVYWFGKNDVLAHDCFPESVSEWADLAEGPEWDVKDRPWTPDHPHYYSFLFTEGKDRRQYPDYARVQAAIDVISKRDSDRPFCIFLATFFPHPPTPRSEGIPPHVSSRNRFRTASCRPSRQTGAVSRYPREPAARPAERARFSHHPTPSYLGMISYADWLVGELLEALEKTGRASDTALILASDHGDWAGDYGLVEKWSNAMDDTLLRVPLIVRAPGGASAMWLRSRSNCTISCRPAWSWRVLRRGTRISLNR